MNTELVRREMALALLKKAIVLYACKSGGWEHDYLRNDVFPLSHFEHMDLGDYHKEAAAISANSTLSGASKIKIPKPRVLVYNIENSGDDAKYTLIRNLIKEFRIAVLTHTSDEWQGSPRKWKYGEGVEVYHMVPLVLRQYGIFPYRSYEIPYPNVIQIPLGYMRSMLQFGNTTLSGIEAGAYSLNKKSSERNLSWAFIGSVQGHKERDHALSVFKAWEPYAHDAGLGPQKMRDVYNNSKFVLVGRGQANLDCFRIYESLIAGAIPIIVGSKWERERAFEFEGDLPPWVFEDDYASALETCKNMTNEKIDAMREKNYEWYKGRIHLIHKKTQLALNVFPPAPE